MEPETWRSLFTVVMFVLFVLLVFWAYSGRRKKDFDAASQLPLEADADNAPPKKELRR